MTISKNILQKINPNRYLANKYLISVVLLFLYVLLTDFYITSEGYLVLAFMSVAVISGQTLGFNSLKLINATTYSVVNQSRLIVMLLIGVMFGHAITLYKVLSIIFCFIGVLLIIKDEVNHSENINKKNSVLGVIFAIGAVLIVSVRMYVMENAFTNNYLSQSAYSFVFILSVLVFFNLVRLFNKKLTKDESPLLKKQFWLLQLSGAFSVLAVIFQGLSVEYAGAFVTAVVNSLAPTLILLFALKLKTEKLDFLKVLGITFTIIGVVVSTL